MQGVQARPATAAELEDNLIKEGLKGTPQSQEEAIDRAYSRYAKPLAGYIRESVAPTLDSDEIATAVNEAFCALARYVAQEKFSASGALSTLLFTLARRKAIDQLRAKTSRKRQPAANGANDSPDVTADMTDDDFTISVTQRLIEAPEVAELWRTAADSAADNEIIRTFRLWIGRLPRVQRKVAEALLRHFGSASDAEIASELSENGESITAASVKSARAEIVRKFTALIEQTERTSMHDSRKRQSS